MRKLSDSEINQFKQSNLLCVDIEGRDPELKEKGPGTHRGTGFICGVGLGTETENGILAKYLPIRHLDVSEEIISYNKKAIRDILRVKNPKIGANIIYDIEWLTHEGFEVNIDTVHDVQYAEPLLNEYKNSYSLDSLTKTYGTELKRTNLLEQYNTDMGWSEGPYENLWKMPADIVAEYAEGDLIAPLQIFKQQKVLLEQQELYDLYTLETKLMKPLLRMRKNGVRLDRKKIASALDRFTELRFKLATQIYNWAKTDFNINSTAQLASIFDKKGIVYPRNPPTKLMREKGKPGNPNLDKKVLSKLASAHAICDTILQYRHADTILNMFLHPYLVMMVGDRLYGSFHPLRSDDYGTVAGRFSASKPNLQQVSAIDEDSDEIKGRTIRELFIPEDGMEWSKLDYSQIEYRIMVHYASGDVATALRERYKNDPKTDMHQVICDATGFDRRTAKRLNFGGAYGMGVATAAGSFGWTMEEATAFMTQYHAAAPYVKKLRNEVSSVASRRGYIKTLLGRRARVHPSRKLHSMFNRLIQGSAADIMKKAMVEAEESGVFDELVLHITVHDELDVSNEQTNIGKEAVRELQRIMENVMKISVPLLVDAHSGDNWASAD
jgi:DNA polymerase I-like protein with 3'-5' exonuclease and polymerase domains